ncbi:ankyrin repeat and LEM domain-containing protein 2 homolog [Drosophila eugracilis]|uniref:ankyrin repeat and LEM domain-containing protein 2 homolog n=1 Tax=Drosophila eugracilis TaxID=29029 RepID=UPI0007E891EC|nr:ankyrin repeat and LEM domain-containing protein 2 homolog [Drosophila eugracilis]
MSTYFGVYIPTSKAGCFEGSTAQCIGSIAAVNIKPLNPASGSATPPGPGLSFQSATTDGDNAAKYEDPDYPPDSPLWLIFTEKSKALDVLRHYKEARLREFPNLEQAESYVQFGFESIEALKRFGKAKPESKPIPISGGGSSGGGGYKSSPGSTDSSYSSSPTGNGSGFIIPLGSSPSMSSILLSSSPTSSPSSTSNSIANGRQQHQQQPQQQQDLFGERPPFRAPTKQELVEFRKQIEGGHIERVKRIIWENPRFLISSGDTPTSLKEGCRYNAMHICAQVNKSRIAQLLLKTVSDREFAQLYAGKKGSGKMCAALTTSLLDYYLNMPDKARGETPLHFASKNGHVGMVEVLISYPECKSLPNHEGKTPKEIICQRNAQASQVTITKLELLLGDPHFVPVLRCTTNTLSPKVGKPFSPKEPPKLQHKTDECEGLTGELTICALAGPMSREKAMNFYRRWKTPPRVNSNVMSNSLISSPFSSPVKVTPNKSIFNRSTGNSSPVQSGRRELFSPLAAATSSPKRSSNVPNGNNECENNNNNVKPAYAFDFPATPIRQMRPDLFMAYRNNNSFDSASMADDSQLMDISLNQSLNASLNDSFRERHIKNSDIEKGLEVVGRQLARQERLEWREYWDFLDTFIDVSTTEGLARLEAYFVEKSEQQAEKSETVWNFAHLHQYFDLMASDQQLRKDRNATAASTTPSAGVMTPYTCVEKSLQVFAKRITKTLINKIGNMVSINDTLLCELKRLKSLIVSFKDDTRFFSVDFSKVHSRIAHLVASYVTHSQEVSVAMRLQLLQMLRSLRKLLADEHGREQHLSCVCGSLLLMLEQAPTTAVHLPDTLKTEELCSAAWETEQGCACLWDANLSRKTSRRKRTKSLRAAAAESQLQGQDTAGSSTLHSSLSLGPTSLGSPRVAVVASPVSKTAWRSHPSDDEDDESDEEVNFFDCSDFSPPYGSSSEDEDNFRTPPESMSPRTSFVLEPRYNLFIFGNEPTKRDLDVLNALANVDIEKETLPHVHAWKAAMESFSSAEMNLFPSPRNVKVQKSEPWHSGTSANHNSQSSLHPKRLLATPKLNSAAAGRRGSGPTTPPMPPRLPRTPSAASIQVSTSLNGDSGKSVSAATSSPILSFAALTSSSSFQTPLNKVRGLFSQYRDQRSYNEVDTPIGSRNGSSPESGSGGNSD